MQEVPQAIADLKDNHCQRCLQPVPDKAARCPGCGQPVQSSSRALRMVIGVGGMIAIVFLVVLIFHTVRNEDAGRAETPVENAEKTPEEELFPPVAPDSKEAPKPEKKPPLNEK